MKKYILTKDFAEISESYGIFQNLSGDANIEITNNTNEQGILLKPFQKVTIRQKVFARKITGGGTAQLIVLPFTSDTSSDDDDDDGESYSYDEGYIDENLRRPRRNHQWCDRKRPPPPLPFFPPDISSPAVIEHDNFYIMRIPKNSLNGQNKFFVQIGDTKGND